MTLNGYAQVFSSIGAIDFMSVFVIDEHPLTREGLVALIHRSAQVAVITELGGLAGLEAAALQHGDPALVCMDLQLAAQTGVSALCYVKKLFPDSAVLVLTAASTLDQENAALEAGADIFLHKTASTHDITKALQTLLGTKKPAAKREEAAAPEKLSKRQKQLLVLLDKGKSNRDIAELLEISEHTVKVHLWRLFRRLNVKSRSQASHLARIKGML